MSSISVLMSVYKSEKPHFLNRSLRSIWSDQILKPNEIVLIEDGPLTRELKDVIDYWKTLLGEKLVILKNDINEGLTKSLNKGVQYIQSKYIARMDSDDISLPDRFKKQLAYMETHPNVMVLGGGMQEINENEIWGAERIYPENQEKILKYIVKANPVAHPTTFIRNSIFEKGYRYNEKYRKNQDLKLWFDLLKDNIELHNLPDTILLFRRTSDTFSKRSSKISLRSELEIYINGIRSIYGILSWRYVYPITRYLVKSMPQGVNAFVYKYLFKKKNN